MPHDSPHDPGARPTDQTVPNPAANKEPAEGSRETVGAGITNRPPAEERENQERVPPRGTNKEGGHA
jgi:hypothetical protein